MSNDKRQVHLAAHFPGVNNTTVWADPESGSHIEFAGFEHFARTAERGLFDFLFLAEGLRLREHKGQIFDQDVVGRPETATVLSALAAVTTRIGLTGTSVNPARSIGPALIAAFAGNTAPLACLWVFIVGPLAGAALAAVTYKALEK